MTLWWMQPGWTDALCARCGVNIHADGGDPDWGYCYSCFTDNLNEERREQEERAAYEAAQEEAYAEERAEWEREQMEEHYRKHPHG